MELRHLRYFVAVAEEKSFTKASEKLFIAQPPLSRQIQQLEAELGATLFIRDSRPLKLTKAGVFFYEHATQVLAKTSELKAMTKRVGNIGRILNIGFVASLLYGILPKTIRKYRAEFNSVELRMYEMTTMEQLKALKEGKIDIGFGRVRHEDADIRRIVLQEEKLIAATPIDHPLAKAKKPILFKDLADENLIIYPKQPRPSYADEVLNALKDRNVRPKKVIEVRELQIAIGLVAAGEGVSIVPLSLQGMKRDDVAYLDLKERHAYSPIIMSVRSMDKSEEINAMLQLLYRIYDEESIPYAREDL
ncbi:LysR family transcriptional regulator [Polynucleobacter sp. 78F-HAINBA]|uniref:LysR family transcriptional regulator n=1 Tax=Polynucleobacter sp. 78F-HAINBA TaxID=2689099 RepID=UPI001C0AFBAB|nr:LysR family transcriptional regulator [Polynucleobacter sp. 78F-HAINBA]MBU3590449.1 LysR family transcriptional regulator [Polynucleobacter sp. 78F-HAINBA]